MVWLENKKPIFQLERIAQSFTEKDTKKDAKSQMIDRKVSLNFFFPEN